MNNILILSFAMLLDFLLGDPPKFPHPIRFIGWMISQYEKIIRKIFSNSLKIGGYFLLIFTVATTVFILTILLFIANTIHPILKITITIYLLYTSLSTRCLHKEVMKVYAILKNNHINKARKQLSYLVGRDTKTLDETGITKALVETTAENTIDGTITPLFFIGIGLLLGLPVQMVFLYKTINTLDSMVGYIHEPYKNIGYASAKCDDVLNYIPARIGSLLILIAGLFFRYNIKNGFTIYARDRYNHKSPNSAHSEAAVAGLLGIQLGGNSSYFGNIVKKPTIGEKRVPINIEHIKDTIKLMYVSSILMFIVIVLVAR